MFQHSPPSISPSGTKSTQESADIERFRARHRRMCRGSQYGSITTSQVESLNADEGRTRKVSAKWRQKQNRSGFDDGNWPVSAGTEMHIGFNAFDFSASPEAFFEEEAEASVESKAPSYEDNQQGWLVSAEKEVTTMGFNSASMWGPIGLRLSTGSMRSASVNQSGVWGAPVHFASNDEQQRALYDKPQYYA
ncbi:hypothetical protein KRP22_008624 [Phytophthora ramorum]|uniref:Uncharacterized protein n=1 Tax=Phytophthora ramorum TaxID=164328 RepID=H3GTS3_PHYRM|nr:hypothetical protein KRP23_2679 [Phytophthora ramorum]KAH7501982.1 hypothetical protein KRP22_7456 [Phytophthora ramorum]